MASEAAVGEVVKVLRGSLGLLARRMRQAVPLDGDLSWAEASALDRLDEDGPAASAELARLEQIRPQSMGATLSGLESRGLVQREADPADGRRVVFSITAAGRRKRLDRRDAGTEQLAVLLTQFAPSELEQLVAAAPLIERLASMAGSRPASGPQLPAVAEDGIDRVEQAWRRERPDIDVSSVGIVSRIWRVGRYLERARKERLAELGTDRVALDVLAMLRRSGPPYRRTAGELTHASLITSGGVSQRLEKLERAGLVTRHAHPADGRRVEVALTPVGMQLVDSVLADLMEHESGLLDELTEGERDDLRRTLKRLLARFERPDPAPPGPPGSGRGARNEWRTPR
jgi:DNA-binding MarR family transcriptional regulator